MPGSTESAADRSQHAQLTAGFHAAAARHHGSDFWRARAGAVPQSHELPLPRALPALDTAVAIDPSLKFARVPMLEGDWIVEADAVDHPALESPAGFIGSMPVRSLLAPLGSPITVRELLRCWDVAMGEERACAMLVRLWRQGLVSPTPASPGAR